jgi:CubicO group peptidase (beta-lactamase class C family)
MKTVLVPLLVLLCTPACHVEPVSWPTAGWLTAIPAHQGLNQAALEELDQEFARGDHGYVDAFLLVRHGYLVHERYYEHDYDSLFSSAPTQTRGPYNYYDPAWHPFYQGGSLHTMQSISKSVTSALIGIAIDRGEITDVDTNVLAYFDGYQNLDDPRRRNWTLRHLLTMTAGIRWEEDALPYTDPANSAAAMEASSDWVQFVLDQPMADDPGTTFVYNSGATQLLSQVLWKATGAHADEYAAEHFFKPLGISQFYWKRTTSGYPDTEGGLYLEARDLAKIGYLYLQRGMWEGNRILPEAWVAVSTTVQMSTGSEPRGLDYGYQWWVERAPGQPAYAALGYGGQRLIVIPELDLIAVFTGWNIYGTAPLDTRFALERLHGMVEQQ